MAAITEGLATMPAGAAPTSLWDLPNNGTRGLAFEELMGAAGQKLPTNFKAFDFWDAENGIATSSKSMNLTDPGYLKSASQVSSTLKKAVDAAADFTRYKLNGVEIKAADIKLRVLQVAVPTSITNAQTVALIDMWSYAASRGVDMHIAVLP
jgi:hypothetical protein